MSLELLRSKAGGSPELPYPGQTKAWHILPVPSCLEGFWVVLSFEADWLSAQPMSFTPPKASLYTSICWRL